MWAVVIILLIKNISSPTSLVPNLFQGTSGPSGVHTQTFLLLTLIACLIPDKPMGLAVGYRATEGIPFLEAENRSSGSGWDPLSFPSALRALTGGAGRLTWASHTFLLPSPLREDGQEVLKADTLSSWLRVVEGTGGVVEARVLKCNWIFSVVPFLLAGWP